MREPVGTKIKVIEAENGALGANGKIGIIVNRPVGDFNNNGINRDRNNSLFIQLDNGAFWNIGCDAKYEVISRNNRIDKNTYVLSSTTTVTIDKFQPNSTLVVEINKNIKDVIYNNPATIVLWKDGTKTVVKCQTETGDTYNQELGLAMCIIKKCCGNKGNYNDVFNKWLSKTTK